MSVTVSGRKAGKEYTQQRAAELAGVHVWSVHRDPKKSGCLLCGPKPCPVHEPFSYSRAHLQPLRI